MKTLIQAYINSKMELTDELNFRNGMVAQGFTPEEANILLLEIHERLENK